MALDPKFVFFSNAVTAGVKALGMNNWAFYEKFDFKVFAGAASQHWLILKNGSHLLRLKALAVAQLLSSVGITLVTSDSSSSACVVHVL